MSDRRGQRRPPNQLRALLPVGRFFGVPIFFAPSWLIIAVLLSVNYAPLIRDDVPGTSSSTAYLTAFGYAVLLALSVLAHELGHTAVAKALGLPVRRVVIFLLGGVSEIERDPDRPRDEFLMAGAGPFVSAVLAAGSFGLYHLMKSDSIPGALFALLFWGNLIVAVFNLLPGLPLDGGRVLRAGIWAVSRSRLTATRAAAWTGRGVAVLVAVSFVVLDRESWGFTVSIVGLFMAAYLWFGATQALRAAELTERIPSLVLEKLLRPGLMVPSDISVAEAIRRAWQGNARGLVLTDGAEHPKAIVDELLLGAVPADRQPWTVLSTVARPLEAGLVLPVGLRGAELLAAVRATPANEYLVVNVDGSPAGILATADLTAALQASG